MNSLVYMTQSVLMIRSYKLLHKMHLCLLILNLPRHLTRIYPSKCIQVEYMVYRSKQNFFLVKLSLQLSYAPSTKTTGRCLHYISLVQIFFSVDLYFPPPPPFTYVDLSNRKSNYFLFIVISFHITSLFPCKPRLQFIHSYTGELLMKSRLEYYKAKENIQMNSNSHGPTAITFMCSINVGEIQIFWGMIVYAFACSCNAVQKFQCKILVVWNPQCHGFLKLNVTAVPWLLV